MPIVNLLRQILSLCLYVFITFVVQSGRVDEAAVCGEQVRFESRLTDDSGDRLLSAVEGKHNYRPSIWSSNRGIINMDTLPVRNIVLIIRAVVHLKVHTLTRIRFLRTYLSRFFFCTFRIIFFFQDVEKKYRFLTTLSLCPKRFSNSTILIVYQSIFFFLITKKKKTTTR